jgi:UDP-GlcNAc:undecaprenyl-phosphate GlcNAc-1-phosphate transferase
VTFPLNFYVAAAASGFVTCASALPFWRRWCVRSGLVDDPGQRKIHDQPTPLAGGLAVMTGLAIPTLMGAALLWSGQTASAAHASGAPNAAMDATSHYLLSYGLHRRIGELGGILLGAIGMLLVGLLDDKHELRAGAKFAAQFLIALLVAASGARITLFVHSILFHYVVTILWILSVINAFNFMDNMNGLCAGLGAIGAFFFGSVAAVAGQYLVALIAFLTFGALLGFLPYNFPRARAFLGDSGSHLVGYLMAVLAILPHFYTAKHPHPWAVLVPLLVLALPLLDMVWVVLLRWRIGQPVYLGDTNHLSHRLVRLGLSRSSAVALIWLAAALLGSLVYLL